MTDTAKIADKINKILAKANSTNSDAEAEALMAKVHSMLEQHGMDLLDLGQMDSDPVGVDLDAVQMAPAEKWQARLLHQVARYYGCDTVHTQGYTSGKMRIPSTMAIAGRESARVTVQAMWPFIRQQVRQLGRDLAKRTGRGPASEVNAVANALTQRVYDLYRAEQRSNDIAKRNKVVNALVPVDEIQAAKEAAFPGGLKQRKGVKLRSHMAAKDAADKVSLYRQTGSSKNQRAIGR